MNLLEQAISLYLEEHHPEWGLIPIPESAHTDYARIQPHYNRNRRLHIWVNDTVIAYHTLENQFILADLYPHTMMTQIQTAIVELTPLMPYKHVNIDKHKPSE